MKRTRLRGLERRTAVVLGVACAAEDADVLTRAQIPADAGSTSRAPGSPRRYEAGELRRAGTRSSPFSTRAARSSAPVR